MGTFNQAVRITALGHYQLDQGGDCVAMQLINAQSQVVVATAYVNLNVVAPQTFGYAPLSYPVTVTPGSHFYVMIVNGGRFYDDVHTRAATASWGTITGSVYG